jgi:hypothetical protein
MSVNLVTWKAEMGELWCQTSSGREGAVSKTPFDQQKKWMSPVIPVITGNIK